MMEARSTDSVPAFKSCIVGRCTIPVRQVSHLPDGGVRLVCGSGRERSNPPSNCKVYQLDDYRDEVRQPPPDRRRKRKTLLSWLFRL